MSQAEHDAFQRFFRDHSRDPNKTPEVMRCLSAFFWKAEQGTYSLSPGWQVAADRIRAAISAAIGQPVAGVELVPVNDIFGGLMDPKSYGWPQWRDLSRQPLWRALKQARLEDLGRSSTPAFRDQYWDSLHQNLLNGLYEAARGDIFAAHPTLGEHDLRWIVLRDNLWLNLGDSLLFFVGFSALGDGSAAAGFQPLIRLLPEAIPLCEKQSEPGHWLVLTG